MSWDILSNDTATSVNGVSTQAELRFYADAPIPAVADMVEAIGAGPVRQRLQERMADSATVKRYGRLRTEADGLQREQRALDATLSRLRAEREEMVTLAAPGFARKLPDVDRQIADLSAKLASVREAAKSIIKVVGEARHTAHAEANQIAGHLSRGVFAEAQVKRFEILARLPGVVGPLLDELAGVEQVLALASLRSLGGDVGAVVEDAARAANVGEEAVSAACLLVGTGEQAK